MYDRSNTHLHAGSKSWLVCNAENEHKLVYDRPTFQNLFAEILPEEVEGHARSIHFGHSITSYGFGIFEDSLTK